MKADVGETGFYRVIYEAENWRALTLHLMENPDSAVSGLVPRAVGQLQRSTFNLESSCASCWLQRTALIKERFC